MSEWQPLLHAGYTAIAITGAIALYQCYQFMEAVMSNPDLFGQEPFYFRLRVTVSLRNSKEFQTQVYTTCVCVHSDNLQSAYEEVKRNERNRYENDRRFEFVSLVPSCIGERDYQEWLESQRDKIAKFAKANEVINHE